jgi:hypothetical protein
MKLPLTNKKTLYRAAISSPKKTVPKFSSPEMKGVIHNPFSFQ